MLTYFNNHPYQLLALVFCSSCALTLVIIPSIIRVAQQRQLYDDLGNLRKIHNPGIPRLGGVAIFISFTITLLLTGLNHPALPLNYILTSCIILFTIGLKDDLAGVGHRTKFLIELITAALLVIPGQIRISNLHNVFGIHELSYLPSVALSMLIIIFVVNAFNLIDGIDGLAASTGIMANLVLSALFIHLGQYDLATVALALAGALFGFLKFNITPAKVFMGDTGSLLIGLITAIMAIKFIEVSNSGPIVSVFKASSAPGIASAILIGPIADTLLVFLLRLAKGKSPFQGDRNHIHHRLLTLGFSHLQTTAMLIALNALYIVLALTFSRYGNTIILSLIVLSLVSFHFLLCKITRLKRENQAHQTKISIKESYKYTYNFQQKIEKL